MKLRRLKLSRSIRIGIDSATTIVLAEYVGRPEVGERPVLEGVVDVVLSENVGVYEGIGIPVYWFVKPTTGVYVWGRLAIGAINIGVVLGGNAGITEGMTPHGSLKSLVSEVGENGFLRFIGTWI